VATDNYSELFSAANTEELTVRSLINWFVNGGLSLPPIQRSIVWSNEQIINYWDSILRGYPGGTMMVHRVTDEQTKGRDSDGLTHLVKKGNLQLFDGQQRITAILLGCSKGQMGNNRRLWVDLGDEPIKSSGLKFQLRITSSGQPFGYRRDAPNQKIELSKRQNRWNAWRGKSPQEVFMTATGGDLIDAKCAVPFGEVYDCLLKNGGNGTISTLENMDGASAEIVRRFVNALEKALESKIIAQQVNSEIVANQEEYIRFFGRLGQGGTRLSDDELTYSIIKHQYPEIHDRMKEIINQYGRLAGEVDLVLAALRVAKTLALPDTNNAKDWEVIGRPTPAFVSQLKERESVESKFKTLMGLDSNPCELSRALDSIVGVLSYNEHTQPKGLPDMFLARLPRELVDVLILFAVKRLADGGVRGGTQSDLRAFVLYWMFFVVDNGKAAWCAFQHGWHSNKLLAETDLVREYEKEGISLFLPRQNALRSLRKEAEDGGNHLLRSWADRFKAAERDDEYKPGEALRVLSTNEELCKRALIWLQRDYIVTEFSDYKPMSENDEDLPVDLDHIIPYDIFRFHWSSCYSRLRPDAISENFRWGRDVVGNSLGNYRWISASVNRSRQEGIFVPLEKFGDLVSNPDDWNTIIPKDKSKQLWSSNDIATFQRLIDLRTLDLYERLLVDSGIESILPPVSG